MAKGDVTRRLAAIVAADVAGYSRLIAADEEGTFAALRTHRLELIEPKIAEYRGRIANTAGDSLLIEFPSVVEALRCAVDVQQAMIARNADTAEDRRVTFRVGIHVGDVIEQDGDLLGDGVNVAARLEGLADPGGVCLSEDAHRQVRDRVEVGYEDLGEVEVKNIPRPIRAYRVRAEGEPATAAAPAKRKVSTRQGVAAAVVLFLVIVGGAGLVWWQQRPDFEPADLDKMNFPLPDKPSIAVLPFDNLSGDPEQDYIGDGLTESIISSLSKISQMLVISRNSTSLYKDKPVTVQTVAEELGVRYVLSGSVQRSGDELRLTAQLIDALKGHQLWSERYDRSLTDLFAVQDDITREIVVALQVRLTAGEQARVWAQSTNNLKAWELYVKGLDQFLRYTKPDNASSRTLAQQAVDLDPDFATAWRLIAWTHWIDARFGWSTSRDEAFQMAAKVAEKAMSVLPEDAETHSLMASIHLFQRDFDQAVTSGQKAVELGPNMADVKATVAIITSAVADWEQTIELIKSAMRLHPRFPSWYLLYLSRAYAFNGDPQMALSTAEQGLDRAESDRLRGGFYLVMAWTLVEAGQIDRAREKMAEALKLTPDLTEKRWRRGYVFRDPANLDRMVEAAKQAGLPE
jgi:TolB-like protein/class 3 adenylate cyclase